MKIKDLFNENGNLSFDPYRLDHDNQVELDQYNTLFDGDGDFKTGVVGELVKLINDNNWPWSCDAIGLYHADLFSNNTKGNYSTIYYFR